MPLRTVADFAAAFRSGASTARSHVEWCLAQIDRLNPTLNAFVHVDAALALEIADRQDEARDHGEQLGPLAGVPFGVKDLEHCAGMPTTKGSHWHASDPPAVRDDIHVARLRAAGAIPIGKTATPEFGAWAYTASPLLGVTRNPWNTDRTPGGSSGGSAAAVASNMVPFCTASDGGGSIRTPAAFTGLPGLKPAYGRVPTYGATHLSQNAVVFALANTVADTALLLDICAGPDPFDRTCLPAPAGRYVDAVQHLDVAGLRAAWSTDLGFAVAEPEVIDLCQRAADRLTEAAALTPVDVPVHLDDYILIYSRIEGADQFVGLAPGLWPERADELDPLIRPGWESAQRVTLPKFAAVHTARRQLSDQVAALFQHFDVLLTLSTAMPAFDAGGPMPTRIAGQQVHGGMSVVYAMLANICNLPAITVPAGFTSDGLPVGLQIIAGQHREDHCLRLAAIAEAIDLGNNLTRNHPLR